MKYEEYSRDGRRRPEDTEQIQSDIQAIRGEMAETLRQIEDRMSPRAFFDQAVDRIRRSPEGPLEFAKNVGQTFRDNPIHVLFIATGAAALLMLPRRSTGGGDDGGIAEAAAGAKEGMAEKAHRARGKLEGATTRGREAAGQVRARAGRLAGATGQRFSQARGRVQSGAERARTMFYEQPLIAIGLGIAIGAVLAGSVPVTERERRTVGELSETARGVQTGGTRTPVEPSPSGT